MTPERHQRLAEIEASLDRQERLMSGWREHGQFGMAPQTPSLPDFRPFEAPGASGASPESESPEIDPFEAKRREERGYCE